MLNLNPTPESRKKGLRWWQFLILATIIIACLYTITSTRLGKTGANPIPGQSTLTETSPIPDNPTSIVSPTVNLSNVPAGLPGIESVYVTGALELKGFQCYAHEKAKFGLQTQLCEYTPSNGSFSATVIIWSRDLATVYMLEATINQYGNTSDTIAKPILGYIATIPFQDTNPDNALLWVESNITKISAAGSLDTTFSEIRYSLHGPPSARSLDIGQTPLDK